jgi:predicted NUDIX family NTP pyrophosphohydrolase
LLYRRRGRDVEVLLAHPGGPFWARKDEGVWTIPKGEPDAGEELLAAAQREFAEETGFRPSAPFVALTPVVQRGGKRVHAWASEGDWDPALLVCNAFKGEWPPGSGKWQEFPEIDRAEWCSVELARQRLNPAQVSFVNELLKLLNRAST